MSVRRRGSGPCPECPSCPRSLRFLRRRLRAVRSRLGGRSDLHAPLATLDYLAYHREAQVRAPGSQSIRIAGCVEPPAWKSALATATDAPSTAKAATDTAATAAAATRVPGMPARRSASRRPAGLASRGLDAGPAAAARPARAAKAAT